MIRALSTAATGLQAQQSNIEQISNDLANVNTDGYKRSRSEFNDLMYQTLREPGAAIGVGSVAPVGTQIGTGVKMGSSYKIMEQGPAVMTYHPYDLMIEGKGFFPVQRLDGAGQGTVFYTKVGAFHKNAQGRLVLTGGAELIPQVTIPDNAISFNVTQNGQIQITLPTNEVAVLGNIQLFSFQNENGLSAEGAGLFRATPASGQPLQGIPGENGFGVLMQGAKEGSNVNVADSMVQMIMTQRAYEMGTKVMSTADQMMGDTAKIRP